MGAAGTRTRVRRGVIVAVVLALVAGMTGAVPPLEKAEAALPPGFTSSAVVSGLTLPTAMAFSPDGKVYVAQKNGLIRVYPSASSNNGSTFINLSSRVYDNYDRGLLGLTVDPRLGNGTGHDFVYVLYAKDAPPGQNPPRWNDNCPNPPGPHTDGCVVSGTLSRIPVNANGTAGAEQILIDNEWCQQFTSHSVGHLRFGPDGYLYVTGGEGASYDNADWGQFGGSLNNTPTPRNPCGDPPGGVGATLTSPTARGGSMRSQSPRRPAGEARVLNGALLRINPDNGAGVPGNPLYNASSPSSNASRILAYGLRNAFRFTMRPGTSETWLGDVGLGDWEEINRVTTPTPARAPNFGWPCFEGQVRLSGFRDLSMCTALYNDTADPSTSAYYAYEHYVPVNANDTCNFNDGSAISGLAFYSGTRYPAAYSNALFFGDQARNCLYVMTAGANGLPDPSTTRTFIDDSDSPYPVDLEVDPISKDIFYVNIGLGTVNRISYASSNRPPVASASATPRSGVAPLAVQLNGSASSDPDGDSLTYSWDTDGNGTFGDATGRTATVTYANGGTYQPRLLVTDTGGLSSTSAPLTLTVTTVSGPANATKPTIAGSAQIGGTLSSSTGTWTGAAPITYARQWQRCTTTPPTSYSGSVLADTPSVYWRLGEVTGTSAADTSGHNRPGTYAGGVTLNQAGALSNDANRAVSLDGENDHVIRNPIAGVSGTAITADLWLKTANTTKDGGIVSYATSASTDEFHLRDPRALAVYVKGTRVATGLAFNDGAWHHLAVTWSSAGGALRVYKDGVLGFSGSVQSGASLTANGALVLGQDQDTVGGGFQPTQAFLGQLDDVALYPAALGQARVQAHRQAGVSGGTSSTSCADITNARSASYSPQLSDQGAKLRVRVTATNPGGTSTAVSASVGPVTAGTGNTRPKPVISSPSAAFQWKAGDTISFSGRATDAQDGTVPNSRLAWSVILGHCTTLGCHEHPVATRNGVASGTLAAPDHQAPAYILFTLTATDAVGATTSVTRRVDPRTVALRIRTKPTGLSVALGSEQSPPAPFGQSWVVNSQVQLNAPLTQTVAGIEYAYASWSDGRAATHTINIPSTNKTYIAAYTAMCRETTYSGSVLADAPSVYWRLGESGGSAAADASGNGGPGTYRGGVALRQTGALRGDANTAVALTGSTDAVVRSPMSGVSGTAFSAELWLKATAPWDAGILSYTTTASPQELQLRDPRALAVYLKGTRVNTGVALNDGAWHHLAVTWRSAGGALRVYKDGALAFSASVRSGASLTADGALALGPDQDSVGGAFEAVQVFRGQLDDVALYPTVLTPAKVQAHRYAGILSRC